jgi:hypothetical protein
MRCKGTTENGKPCKLEALPGKEYCYLHRFTPIVVRERCHAIGKNGQRCSKKTLRGIYCFIHHRSLEHIKIAPSTIPNAGLGLFAVAPTKIPPADGIEFHRGDKIVPYNGDVIVVNRNDEADAGDNYALQIKQHPLTLISARRTNTGSGRYANAKRGGAAFNNAQLRFNNRAMSNVPLKDKEGYLEATKDIKPGDEITVVYGRSFWSSVASQDRERARDVALARHH